MTTDSDSPALKVDFKSWPGYLVITNQITWFHLYLKTTIKQYKNEHMKILNLMDLMHFSLHAMRKFIQMVSLWTLKAVAAAKHCT